MQQEKKLDLEDSELSKVVRHLINRVSELKMLDFYKDQELINGLNIHLDPVLKRLSYDLSVSNPMLHDIKKCILICFILSLTF